MKVFVLYCSPHKKGATRRLLHEFLQERGIENVDFFDAYELSAKPCIDCGYCAKNDGCAFDDLDELYSAVEEADLLIFASPVYFLSLPAPAKAIMDRLQRYFAARFFRNIVPPIKKPKKTVLLLTYESEKYGGISHIVEQFNMLSTVLNSSKPEVIASRRENLQI